MMQFHGAPPSLLTSLPSMKKSTCFIVVLETTSASQLVPSMIFEMVWPLVGLLNATVGPPAVEVGVGVGVTVGVGVGVTVGVGVGVTVVVVAPVSRLRLICVLATPPL